MNQELLNRIVINPRVMVGKPIIRGTRIPVEIIIKLFAQGMTEKDMQELKQFSSLLHPSYSTKPRNGSLSI